MFKSVRVHVCKRVCKQARKKDATCILLERAKLALEKCTGGDGGENQ
jgi:hypothetical protein